MSNLSRQKKIIAVVILLLFLACVCCGAAGLLASWFMNNALVSDTADLQNLSAEIADFTMPENYAEVFGIRLMGMDMVAIGDQDNFPDSMLIMMMKVPDTGNIDREALEKQIEGALQQQLSMQRLDLTLDDVKTRTVNGQQVALTYRKGRDTADIDFRQMSTLFSTDKGQVLMMVQGETRVWNQSAIDTILDTIH